jgi:hypothetical protein
VGGNVLQKDRGIQYIEECDFVWDENKVETIEGIDSLNLLNENNSKCVKKPFKNYYSPINMACIRMSTWRN